MINKLSKNKDVIVDKWILSKFPQLEKITGGVCSGQMITIGARAGCGKTSLALNLLEDFSKYGNCLLASLEMNSTEIRNRLFKIGIPITDNIYFTESDNHEEIEKAIDKYNIKVVFIDYVQLMEGSIKQNTRWLKELALNHNVVVFVMSQLNRYACNNEPKLEMLSTSDKIAHDSDQVWLITENKIIVAKNRNGSTGTVWVKFDKPKFRFKETNLPLKLRNYFIQRCNEYLHNEQFDTLKQWIELNKNNIDKDLYEQASIWYEKMYKSWIKRNIGLLALWKMWKI